MTIETKTLSTLPPGLSPLAKIMSNMHREKTDRSDVKKLLRKASQHKDIDLSVIKEMVFREGLPEGYGASAEALYSLSGKVPVQFTFTPVFPYAKCFSADSQSDMQLLLVARNQAGKIISIRIKMDEMYADIDRVMASLAHKGVAIDPARKNELIRFILKCMDMTLPCYLVTPSMGMIDKKAAFLHGKTPIFCDLDGFENIIPASVKRIPEGIKEYGELDQWQELIVEHAKGDYQIFAIMLSLASPLLGLAGQDIAIFHFYGLSTTGKTILLQLSASCHGYGGDAGSNGPSLIARWNATSNGIESHAALQSGTVVCLDELGAFSGKELSSLIYNLTSGVSKIRMDKTQEMREPFRWNSFFVSSGEISFSHKLREKKQNLQGGHEHRVINLQIFPEDAGAPGEGPEIIRQHADKLKSGLEHFCGTAGPAFLCSLLSQTDEEGLPVSYQWLHESVKARISECEGLLLAELVDERYLLTDVQLRALRRFSFVMAVGLMAQELGILPYSPERIATAVWEIVVRWLSDTSVQYNPVQQALIDIQRDLVKREGAHFIGLKDRESRKPGNHWGYIHHINEDFLIFAPVFEEWCQKHSLNAREVSKELACRKLLRVESKGHYKKRPLTGMDKCYYHIKREFISADLNFA